MTTFADGLYQYGGLPVGGMPPSTFGAAGPGKVYFVNPDTGADGNSGLQMDRALATIARAYELATTNNHDVIALSASSALAETDQLAVTKNRIHFWGMDAVGRWYGQRSRWTMGDTSGESDAAIAIVKNTGVGNTFTNIKFDSSDVATTSVYAFAEGGEYTVIEHCEIYKSTDLDQAGAAELLMNGDSALVRYCTIGSLANQVTAARTNVLLTRETITGKVARDVTFDNCLLWLKSSSATACHFHTTTATDVERMLWIKDCAMVVAKLSGGTVGDAIIVDATLTDGQILLQNSYNFNSTAIGTTGSVGILYAGAPVATAATAGNAIAVTD